MPYETPRFRKQLLLGHLMKEIRPLNKPIRCIVLDTPALEKIYEAKIQDKGLEICLLDLAKELDIYLDYFWTSAKPLGNLETRDFTEWTRNDDRELSIALEGRTYSIDDEKIKKLCEFFEIDPSKIEKRYPEREWWW